MFLFEINEQARAIGITIKKNEPDRDLDYVTPQVNFQPETINLSFDSGVLNEAKDVLCNLLEDRSTVKTLTLDFHEVNEVDLFGDLILSLPNLENLSVFCGSGGFLASIVPLLIGKTTLTSIYYTIFQPHWTRYGNPSSLDLQAGAHLLKAHPIKRFSYVYGYSLESICNPWTRTLKTLYDPTITSTLFESAKEATALEYFLVNGPLLQASDVEKAIHNINLRVLNVSHITEKGADSLNKALSSNNTLKELTVRNGFMPYVNFLGGLSDNQGIEKLTIKDDEYFYYADTNSDFSIFFNMLRENKTIKKLSLSDNKSFSGESNFLELISWVTTNETLEKLDLRECGCTFDEGDIEEDDSSDVSSDDEEIEEVGEDEETEEVGEDEEIEEVGKDERWWGKRYRAVLEMFNTNRRLLRLKLLSHAESIDGKYVLNDRQRKINECLCKNVTFKKMIILILSMQYCEKHAVEIEIPSNKNGSIICRNNSLIRRIYNFLYAAEIVKLWI